VRLTDAKAAASGQRANKVPVRDAAERKRKVVTAAANDRFPNGAATRLPGGKNGLQCCTRVQHVFTMTVTGSDPLSAALSTNVSFGLLLKVLAT
jgi:hypothetical protein